MTTGHQLKLDGMESVLARAPEEWQEAVVCAVSSFERGEVVTAEDIRIRLEKLSPLEPHHPNAWGAMISGLVKRGMLVPTGEMPKARRESSHERKIQQYRVSG